MCVHRIQRSTGGSLCLLCLQVFFQLFVLPKGEQNEIGWISGGGGGGQPRCDQQPEYAYHAYRKPLSYGHPAIMDKMLVPNGVRYREVPLYHNKILDFEQCMSEY